jgi:hypothetical protein
MLHGRTVHHHPERYIVWWLILVPSAEEVSASFQLEALNAELTALKLDRAYAIVPAGSVLPVAQTPPPSSPKPTPQVTALSASFISHTLPSFPPSIRQSISPSTSLLRPIFRIR